MTQLGTVNLYAPNSNGSYTTIADFLYTAVCQAETARSHSAMQICAHPVWVTAVHDCSWILYHVQHVTLHCRWALAKGAMLVWWVFTRFLHRCEAAPTSKSSARQQLQHAQASTVQQLASTLICCSDAEHGMKISNKLSTGALPCVCTYLLCIRYVSCS